ncbi:CPBP family glutamic-type intramembrane protease [Natrinema zhouii]|uniref:CPBP family intramembrane metalloprotease n=1 Tax=Natrinema zhouii TaxID=1710539 RepID=A0A7D6CNF0_9EURY|nr:CPBP family glutamic-type intramembrane protease [Natrinema zhouii]QLK24996.1 CPBP family glutamic-type intramembrane protease [Natrinema zhouii]
MPQWATFVGITGVVLVLLLVLSHLTQSAFTDGETDSSDGDGEPVDGLFDSDSTDQPIDSTGETSDSTEQTAGFADQPSNPADQTPDSSPHTDEATPDSDGNTAAPTDRDSIRETGAADDPLNPDSERNAGTTGASDDDRRGVHPTASSESHDASIETHDAAIEADRERADRRRPTERGIEPGSLSTGMILANVAFSQGLFALVLLGAALYTAIPASALGIEFSLGYLETGLLLGTAAGVGLYLANELAAAAATKFGFDHDEALRELLSPDSISGWLVLLLGVLPIIAFFEEFLFRAALIGVPAAGFGLSPWLLAIGSSIAFALGHGMQGSVGVVVTGLLGLVLATVYIATGSLLVVVVAHYLINALEFVVHEGFDLEWAETLEG